MKILGVILLTVSVCHGGLVTSNTTKRDSKDGWWNDVAKEIRDKLLCPNTYRIDFGNTFNVRQTSTFPYGFAIGQDWFSRRYKYVEIKNSSVTLENPYISVDNWHASPLYTIKGTLRGNLKINGFILWKETKKRLPKERYFEVVGEHLNHAGSDGPHDPVEHKYRIEFNLVINNQGEGDILVDNLFPEVIRNATLRIDMDNHTSPITDEYDIVNFIKTRVVRDLRYMMVEKLRDMLEEVKEIAIGKPYHWRNWNIVRSHYYLYLWSNVTAIELWNNSAEGWFDFIIDEKFRMMFPDGENRADGGFIWELQEAKNQVKSGHVSQSIFPTASQTRITFGTWTLSSTKEGELTIHHSVYSSRIFLREDLSGFIFESYRGTRYSFETKTTLDPEFGSGWAGKK